MSTFTQWCLGSVLVCGAILVAGYVYQRRADARDAKRLAPPGRLVAVRGRQMHLLCKGQGTGTIVIEQGAGEPARLWWPVQDRLAGFARVCTYDRAGYGWSEPAFAPRSIDERIADLHDLLINAQLPAPFLLVAHSYGGLLVRRFTEQYPELVGGMVLVDTPEEAVLFRPEVLRFYARVRGMLRVVGLAASVGLLRLLATRYALEGVGLPFVRATDYAAARDDLQSLETVPAAMRSSGGFGSVGDRPLAVISHGQPFPAPFAVLEQGWHQGQQRLAALSTQGELIVSQISNHMVQHDDPDRVVETIRRIYGLMTAVRYVHRLQPSRDGCAGGVPP